MHATDQTTRIKDVTKIPTTMVVPPELVQLCMQVIVNAVYAVPARRSVLEAAQAAATASDTAFRPYALDLSAGRWSGSLPVEGMVHTRTRSVANWDMKEVCSDMLVRMVLDSFMTSSCPVQYAHRANPASPSRRAQCAACSRAPFGSLWAFSVFCCPLMHRFQEAKRKVFGNPHATPAGHLARTNQKPPFAKLERHPLHARLPICSVQLTTKLVLGLSSLQYIADVAVGPS